MDPSCYQLLNHKLQEWKSEDIPMIFSQVKDCICMVMLNRSGSDLLRKLYKECDEEQMTQLVSSVTDDLCLLMTVCLDSQGSESMQEFLGFLTPKQVVHMISFFTYIMIPLANDQFGSRVIRQYLEMFPAPAVETEPIVDVMAENCLELAYDKYGSDLLQHILSKATILSSKGIVSKIISKSYSLSTDEFGHQVMLHVIGLEMPFDVACIVYGLQGYLHVLATDEYGSIVLKKLIKAFEGKFASEITRELITGPAFLGILLDPDGRSVLESAKTYSRGRALRNLNDLILRHSDLLDKKRKMNHACSWKNMASFLHGDPSLPYI
ncbi:pumilio homolog 12-like [Henckelia pumila]|uniref:pumilio homolog 12-like n=1 Tax=Henckelia pumila TaxID=405737 RepID=UPI003C6E3803